MHNNIDGNFGKMHMAVGEALDAMRVGDMRIMLPNRHLWTLQ